MERTLRALLPALLLLGGCLAPDIPEGYQCSDTGACPPGQVCETASGLCRLPDNVRAAIPPGSGADRPAAAAATVFKIAKGAGVTSGVGFVITANSGVVRLTWQGYSEFRGSVFADPKVLLGVAPGCSDQACKNPADKGKTVASADLTRVDFVAFPTYGTRGGFDVTLTSDDATLTFDLLVDGERHPERVFFTSPGAMPAGQASSPADIPFATQAVPQK